MCGICGIVGDAAPDLLGRMMLALRHRGPDDEGMHVDRSAGVALGHLRLSIIDVAGGRQPIFNEDGSLCIVFNGEIYNYRSLRAELEGRGHRFSTRSDTEVILHLYENLGVRTPERLQGMFAFAIWDRSRRELFLARDRLGVKPLFYCHTPGRFLFASELKSVLSDPALPRDLDRTALDEYLTFLYVPAPRTLMRGVSKLPPGCSLSLRDGRVSLRRYWELPRPARGRSARCLRHAVADLRDLLEEAVRCRLMSEVPLGGYLSGGLDSSLVVALMSKAAAERPRTFTVGFEERGYDERRFARDVAERFGTVHRELVCRHPEPSDLRRILWHLDEPVADAACMPTYLMAEATKPHATVVLTGEGADEVFAGYSHYKIMLLGKALGRAGVGPVSLPGLGSSLLSRAVAFAGALPGLTAAWLALKSVFTPTERRELLCGDDDGRGQIGSPEERVRPFLEDREVEDDLHRLLRLDLATWLPDDLLVKVDRMTMAHAVEARVPYLDYRVVEAVLALPAGWKLRGGVSKYLLRQAASGLLPRATAWRRKTGFAVPVGEWADAGQRDVVEDVLGPASVRRRGWMDPDWVRRLLARQPFTMFRRRQFWALFTLEMWCRAFLDADPSRRP